MKEAVFGRLCSSTADLISSLTAHLSRSDLTTLTLIGPKWNLHIIEPAPRTGSAHLRVLTSLDTHLFVYRREEGSAVGFHSVPLTAQDRLYAHANIKHGMHCLSAKWDHTRPDTQMHIHSHRKTQAAVKALLDMEANIAFLLPSSPQGIILQCCRSVFVIWESLTPKLVWGNIALIK